MNCATIPAARLPVEQLTARKVPACVVALMERVLALDPSNRPASAREMPDALDAGRQRLGEARAPISTRRKLTALAATSPDKDSAFFADGVQDGNPHRPGESDRTQGHQPLLGHAIQSRRATQRA